MIRKEIKGITLIALIITIIVLLILAGVTIEMLTGENSILKSAEMAKEETRGDSVQETRDLWFTEVKLANRTGNTAKTLDEILNDLLNQGLLNSNEVNTIKTTENNEITIGSRTISFKIENINTGEPIEKIPKVGDYVEYTPDPVTVTAETQIIKDLQSYSGNKATGYNTENEITQENLSWRVLDITNGQVTLISDTPTTHTVRLEGANGYNNGVKLLDDLCKTLYSKTGVGVSRSLKIEDIEDRLTYDYTQYANSQVDTGLYGGTKEYTTAGKKYYPNIFAQETIGTVDGTAGTTYGLSEQNSFVTGHTEAGTSIKVTQTYWSKKTVASDFKDYNSSKLESMYYKIFINGSSNTIYWLSSRCINAEPYYATFRIYNMATNGEVRAFNLYYSDYTETERHFPVRPVVTLESNIQIDTSDTTKDGSTKELAWKLK